MSSPFPKERARVSGGEIAYVDQGEGSAVVLIHGFPTSSFLWRAFVPVLAGRMRVIAPDLLGYGDSEKLPDADLNMRAQAGYVRELLGSLGVEEFAVFGHDVGGAVAQILALEGGVRTLGLIDSVGFDGWPIEAVKMIQGSTPEQETPEFAAELIRLAIDLGVQRKERLTPDVLAEYLRPFQGEAGARAVFRAARAIDGEGLRGRERDVRELDLPVLIMWGEEDPFLGVDVAERLSDAYLGSTLALLPGCSHLLPEDAPESIVPIVYEYLRSRYLSEHHGHHDGLTLLQLERRDPT